MSALRHLDSELDRPHMDTSAPLTRDGPAAESALVVEHLTKRFADRVAFDDVSFEVGYGEVFGFLGPNGAGKTTTVRTLGTLIAPSSGSAMVAGIPLTAKNGPAIRARYSSRTAAFDAAEGQVVAFRCGEKRFLPIFLASFAVPSLAIPLKRD